MGESVDDGGRGKPWSVPILVAHFQVCEGPIFKDSASHHTPLDTRIGEFQWIDVQGA